MTDGTAGDVGAGSGTAPSPAGIAGLAAWLARSSGWHRAGIAFATGAVATLALPPVTAAPLLWFALPVLLWLLDGCRTVRQAFLVGWCWGFGHFLVSLYWITAALFVDIAQFWWVLPFAAAALPMGLALFIAGATALLHLSRLQGLARVLAFAVLWCCGEWLRGHVLTGFPWNLVGYAWTGWLPVVQTAALVGVYGLGLLTVAAAATPYLLGIRRQRGSQDQGTGSSRSAPIAVAVGIAGFALIAAGGAVRMAVSDGTPPGDPVHVRLVQPNLIHTVGIGPERAARAFSRMLALQTTPPPPPRTVVVWPETAVPFPVENAEGVVEVIGRATPQDGMTFVATTRAVTDGQTGRRRFHNSLIAIDPDGVVQARFDKAHLVPFGEYVPLRSLAPGLVAVAAGENEFTPGPGPTVWSLPGLPAVSPAICYEVIFPGSVVPPWRLTGTEGRPAWIVTITNDSWYGETAGPHQHFAIARMRAVEQGVPVIRAALTGLSGVIDAQGAVTAVLGLGQTGVVDAVLPPPLPPTPYARFGDLSLVVLLMIFAAAVPIARLRC